MAYSRIVNVEYKSEKDMKLFLSKWKDWMAKHMPVATVSYTHLTLPTILLV